VDCTPTNNSYNPLRLRELSVDRAQDSVKVSGRIEVIESLPISIEVEISVTRCALDGRGCYSFQKLKFPRICEKMKTETSFSFKIVQGVSPTPHCPIAPGWYNMSYGSTVPFDFLKILPLEGFNWKLKLVGFEKNKAKRVRSLCCVNVQIQVERKEN
jgi:hypothetical protein